MSEMRRIIRQSGILDVTEPVDVLKLMKNTNQVVADDGSLKAKAGDPYRSPLVLHWFSGDPTRKERAAQSGVAVLFSAWADTAPSSGSCVVSLTMNGGVVANLYILNGNTTAELGLSIVVPNGSWFESILTTPNGAANVSTSLTINVGSGS